MMRLGSGILFISLIFAAPAYAQQAPNAALYTKFGILPCEHVLMQVEGFAAELRKEPTSTAAILIYRPKRHPTEAEKRRYLISSTLQLVGVKRERFAFFMAGPSPDGLIRTELWKVPATALSPGSPPSEWNEPDPKVHRPFMFASEDESRTCPTFVPSAFAKLILENPGAIGRIIVYVGIGPADRFWFAKNFIDKLVDEYNVPRKRLRLIFRKTDDLTFAEFWYVPGNTQRYR